MIDLRRTRDASRAYKQAEEIADAEVDADRRQRDFAEEEAQRELRKERARDRVLISALVIATVAWTAWVCWGAGIMLEMIWHWIHG
jgi:hypothetical protein